MFLLNVIARCGFDDTDKSDIFGFDDNDKGFFSFDDTDKSDDSCSIGIIQGVYTMTFINENFLLKSDTAVTLYNYCKDLPIIDYHSHFNPKHIAENKRFSNITELALGDDHYKWRLMRANGIDEKYITGDGPDEDKFRFWCATVEDAIGNPLYHWTHLEMQRYFGYNGPINKKRADYIYAHCNEIINGEDFSVWGILKKFRIEMMGTTDSPLDNLEYHRQITQHRKNDPSLPDVQPTFRPQIGINWYNIKKIGEAADNEIKNWDDLLTAYAKRIDFFHDMGCRISDHGLDSLSYEENGNQDTILKKFLRDEALSTAEVNRFKTALMVALGEIYAAKGWAMQLRMGGMGNNNTRMAQLVGGSGYAAISDEPFARPLSKLLNAMETKKALPKTILYGLNPVSDTMLSVMIGAFQGDGIPGKIQWGCPWWFNDNKTGIQNHLIALGNNGLVARFIGMLTDARSYMSYPRHEYFRRVMAQTIADWVDNGEFPKDDAKLRQIVEGIAYRNAKEYFGFSCN